MNLSATSSSRRRYWDRRRQAAFTFGEMMVTVSIFMLMMVGILYSFIFGLNLYQVTKIKLGASDEARKAVIKITDEIRSANKVYIGNANLTNFVGVATNAVQNGNAIQIFPTTNVASYIVYFYDTNIGSATYTKLLRTTNGFTSELVIAHSITNATPIFTSEDANGNVLTNNLNNRVIGMTLQFYQIEYPIVRIGPGNYYDFYQLRTKITRRTLY